jgi:hypothetical protein
MVIVLEGVECGDCSGIARNRQEISATNMVARLRRAPWFSWAVETFLLEPNLFGTYIAIEGVFAGTMNTCLRLRPSGQAESSRRRSTWLEAVRWASLGSGLPAS